ncbi:hypothetical protein BYT27DRAFT_7088146 [Phlegmacium glaucopus]|nr:hypothetical protein BYT27DRAFT_7088146 [Phlegmacium glaucopus]
MPTQCRQLPAISPLDLPAFAGIPGSTKIDRIGEIEDSDIAVDMEDEQGTVPDLAEEDLIEVDDGETLVGLPSQWSDTITGASKAVSERTEKGYQRLVDACMSFLISKNLIKTKEEFLCKSPPQDSARFIIAWIMNECDSCNLDGSNKSSSTIRSGYTHAQKMRAAMTYAFGRLYGCGNRSWQMDESQGVMVGNPSISTEVSNYMLALHRRKVQGGETSTSARAMTPGMMEKLYDFNHQAELWEVGKCAPNSRNAGSWGGPFHRRLVQAVYTISYLCLLRIDEVLKIRREHIKLEEEGKVTLTLPFRKTHQFGGKYFM